MNLIFIGPQASGKGTQAKIIASKLGYVHLSTGAMFRAEIEKGTKLGKLAASLINDGNMVPDDVTNKIMLSAIKGYNNRDKQVILDGYPRNVVQAQFLINNNIKIKNVVVINISEQETIKRLGARYHCPKCKKEYNTLYPTLIPKQKGICDICGIKLVQRKDDIHIESIQKRLQIYHDETEKVIDLFKGKVIKVDGEQVIEKVTEDILSALS